MTIYISESIFVIYVLKLIIGLGNPGRSYKNHRHNIGFMIIERLAQKHDLDLSKKTFGSKMGKGKIDGSLVVLAEPETYMNRSGIAVAPLVGFYKCDLQDLIVVHDDIDLEFGRIKLVKGAGHGGHNGVKSISEELGTDDYVRVRVGVDRPVGNMDPADYVLQNFSEEQKRILDEVIDKSSESILCIMKEGLVVAQQRYH